MRISVIVPLYNKSAHILRCLESIARQTFTDFEVIVVNDGSTDDSGNLAASFQDPRFRLVTQSNAGPGAARNRGASEAHAGMLAFLDADDEWLPEYLASNIAALEAAGDSVAAVACAYLESGVDFQSMWRSRGLVDGPLTAARIMNPLLLVYAVAYMSPWNTIVRTAAFRRLGGFYDRTRAVYAEDAWLWVQVLLNYSVLIRLSPPLVKFHREASELSANLRGARPVEPFLLYPDAIRQNCPSEAASLLDAFLAIRAFKTACMLGYWGQWREANRLRAQFGNARNWKLPYYWPALVSSSPLALVLGNAWRAFGRKIPLGDLERFRAAVNRRS